MESMRLRDNWNLRRRWPDVVGWVLIGLPIAGLAAQGLVEAMKWVGMTGAFPVQ